MGEAPGGVRGSAPSGSKGQSPWRGAGKRPVGVQAGRPLGGGGEAARWGPRGRTPGGVPGPFEIFSEQLKPFPTDMTVFLNNCVFSVSVIDLIYKESFGLGFCDEK